jgi:hypothetical protein
MMEIALLLSRIAGVAVCGLILVACICRLDLLTPRLHKLGWRLMYLLYAAYAGGVLIDLATAQPVDWYEAAGIAGVLIHVALTRRLWRDGPPSETCKEHPACN